MYERRFVLDVWHHVLWWTSRFGKVTVLLITFRFKNVYIEEKQCVYIFYIGFYLIALHVLGDLLWRLRVLNSKLLCTKSAILRAAKREEICAKRALLWRQFWAEIAGPISSSNTAFSAPFALRIKFNSNDFSQTWKTWIWHGHDRSEFCDRRR